MKLSVIIVSYNVKYFLEQCLYSVMEATRGIEAEVLVVDNDSPDKSIDYLQPVFPGVRFIAAGGNLGFARANNLGLSQARGEYILFLNPDTLIPENCLQTCTFFLDTHHKAGALGVKMIDGSGKFLPESKRSFPKTSTAFYKAIGLSALFPRSITLNRYALGYLDPGKNHIVEVLAGAFMMIRKNVLDKTGSFDEGFFMYGEDIDLSYRLKQAGYDNWYLSETCIIHFKGESTKKGSPKHVKMFYEAMIVFVKKHYRGAGAGFFRLLLFSGIRSKAFVSLVTGSLRRKKINPQIKIRSVIAGTEEEYKECLHLYRSSGLKKDIAGRLDVLKQGEEPFSDALKKFADEHRAQEIIFCQGHLQYSTIIDAMQRMGTGYTFRFHAAGSKSIVGSDSKSELGITVAL